MHGVNFHWVNSGRVTPHTYITKFSVLCFFDCISPYIPYIAYRHKSGTSLFHREDDRSRTVKLSEPRPKCAMARSWIKPARAPSPKVLLWWFTQPWSLSSWRTVCWEDHEDWTGLVRWKFSAWSCELQNPSGLMIIWDYTDQKVPNILGMIIHWWCESFEAMRHLTVRTLWGGCRKSIARRAKWNNDRKKMLRSALQRKLSLEQHFAHRSWIQLDQLVAKKLEKTFVLHWISSFWSLKFRDFFTSGRFRVGTAESSRLRHEKDRKRRLAESLRIDSRQRAAKDGLAIQEVMYHKHP